MKINDLMLGILLLLFCTIGLLYTNLTFPMQDDGMPGPASFPNVIFSLLTLCSLILIVRCLLSRKKVPAIAFPNLDLMGAVSIIVLLLFILSYIFYSEEIGFIPLSLCIVFFLSLWLKVNWKVCLISAVITTAVIYLVFVKILLVPLPMGIINI